MGRGVVRLVLDTCVLRDKDFMSWLYRNYTGELATSAVAYMEFRRQIINNGRDLDNLESLLKALNISVIPFDKSSAMFASELMYNRPVTCEACGKLDWVDTMIYTSIGNPPTLLVTHNVSDFPTEGDRVYTPQRIVETYGR